MAIQLYKYFLLKPSVSEFNLPEINAYIPTPSDIDYKREYIQRYFIQKANDVGSHIFEISDESRMEFIASPFYTITSITWKIVGPLDEIREANRKSIQLGCKVLPNLYLYLSNPIQLAKV
jgi:hypothetical protein